MIKKFPWVLISSLFIWSLSFAAMRNIQDNFELVYNIVDTAGNHVAGQVPTAQIKKISTGNYYDFSDNSFKASPTTGTINLTEETTGNFYYYLFNPPASETAAEQYLFIVTNTNATYKDHQSMIVTYQDLDKTGYSLSAAGIDSIWDEVQSGHTSVGTFGKYLDSQVSSVGGGTASQIADAIWDEATSGHTTTGTTGKALIDSGSAGNPWSTDISTGYNGTAGEYVRNIKQYTDYEKHDGDYKGISKGVRSQR